MTIQFSGVGSGLPVSDWITALMQTANNKITNLSNKIYTIKSNESTLSTVKTKFATLESSVQKFTDANLSKTMDIFLNKVATSSDTSVATATAANNAISQNVMLSVAQLATATVANSSSSMGTNPTLGTVAPDTTPLSSLNDSTITAGKFTLTVNGTQNAISVDSTTTVSNLEDKIKAINSSLNVNFDSNGNLSVGYNSGGSVTSLAFGAVGDTSNFLTATKLSTASAVSSANADGVTTDTTYTTGNALTTGSTALSNIDDGQLTAGNFSFYVNGQKTTIAVDANTTLAQVVNKMKTANSNLNVSFNSGKLSVSYNSNTIQNFSLGANSDTSNFWNIMQLSSSNASTVTNTDSSTTTTYSSASPISDLKSSTLLVGTNGSNPSNTAMAVTAGNFIIGGATFTVAAGTTLGDLINKINNTSAAGVIAQFNSSTGAIKLTSTTPGNTAINLEEVSGGSNFLRAAGLIDNATGNTTSSQTLGQNAKVYLNGSSTPIYSNSNTLTSDVTGLPGVTIKLLKTTNANSNNVDVPVSISVSQDTSSIASAMSDFVSNFNSVITEVRNDTAVGSALYNEFQLSSLTNNIRSISSNSVSGLTTYNSIQSLGVTTGAVGTSVTTDTSTLIFNQSTFLAALAANPDQVKTLLIGNSSSNPPVTGVLQNLLTSLKHYLDPSSGYFASAKTDMDSQISDLNDQITQQQSLAEAQQSQLTNEFTAMDTMISKMKAAASAAGGL